ncbi:F0F1 ATP synthase subunit delta [Microbacterium murale]|uniref:ATP synthase subunit delta n=1 Tax=Microbacterium murale TaxID=1081040 RepID=A0ABU0PCV9_9MICO|nr:F0F1 ATP synthase subunit delta [Microbacterium murale]MDQ0645169.1 F-type H+-transporting ATPase subunit delta [Microbacterium murale]
MGSATTQALAASTAALAEAKDVTLDTAGELFTVARLMGESGQLSGALADPAAPAGLREQVVAKVFGGVSNTTRQVLSVAVGERWSDEAGLIAGIEELAIRAAAIAEPKADIEGELFSFLRVIAANPELELALGSRLGDDSAKGSLVEKLIGSTASAPTTLIVSSLVRQPRKRRVRQLLSRAMKIVSAQGGRIVATVHTAAPLSAAQRTRLGASLAARYDGQVSINEVIDPSVVGGLRVQVADDVIDGSISARLADLRQKLAG